MNTRPGGACNPVIPELNRARHLLKACDQILIPVAGIPAADRTACHVCGRPPAWRISLRINGMEMLWLDGCADHQVVQTGPDPAAYHEADERRGG